MFQKTTISKKGINYIKYIIISFFICLSFFLFKLNLDYFLKSDATLKNIVELNYKKNLVELAVKEKLISDEQIKNLINKSMIDKKISIKEVSSLNKEYDLLLQTIPSEKIQSLLMNVLEK